jgi:pyruvate/2-oxoglutarate dehydrogenase complex dihydrolipoamide acyltransferase (E2) component
MEEAFGVVLVVVVVVAAVVAVGTLLVSGDTYRQIGRGGLSLNEDDDRGRPSSAAPAAPASRAEADAEIRQMMAARNARRERRGQAPLDVDAEVAKLSAPVGDAGLREEVRQLVLARNARRARRGKAPLDVEAEVARQLRDLS